MAKLFSLVKLRSGAQLLRVPMTQTGAITILVSVKVGSRHETDSESGLSHFLEHMFFKGSAQFPTTLELASALDGLGAEFNAWTGKELTEYYIKVSADQTEAALSILADLFLRPQFPVEELAKEKAVILQEINLIEDSPERYVEDLMESALYLGHPIGRLIIGSRETVSRLTREQLLDYLNRHYLPRLSLITLAGNLRDSPSRLRLEALFDFKRPPVKRAERPPAPHDLPTVRVLEKSTEQTHLCLGFLGYPHDHPRRAAFRLLALILGGTMSSRLFSEVREKRGLAYYIRASAQSYSDTGYLEIHAGLDTQRLGEAYEVILAECRNIRDAGVSPAELRRAQTVAKGRLLLHLEQSEAVADYYASQVMLTRQVKTPAQVIREIESVTQAMIREVAAEILTPGKAAAAIISKTPQEKSLEKAVQAL